MFRQCVILLLALLLEQRGLVAAAMTCPDGYVTQYGPTAAGGTAVRCCNNLAPGNLTCTTTYTVDMPGDYLVYCTDLFPTPSGQTCHCGRDCSGTVMPDKTCNGTCLCTTIYCCSIPGIPCNFSSPSASATIAPEPSAPILDQIGAGVRPPSPPTPPPPPTRAPVAPTPWVILRNGAASITPYSPLVLTAFFGVLFALLL